jgi:TetR/AcrR family transcriptional regulator
MTTLRPRNRDPGARRQEILLAAGRVIVHKGFRAATMEEIASRAEIGVGTLYHYFRSKEHLFSTLLAESVELLGERLRTAAAMRLPPALGVLALLRAYVDYFAEFPEYFRIQMSFSHDLPAEGGFAAELENVAKLGRRNLEVLADKIRAGQESGTFRAGVDPMAAAAALWAAYNGILFASMNQPFLEIAGLDVERLHAAAAFVQFAGLNADPALAPIVPEAKPADPGHEVSVADLQEVVRSLPWIDPAAIFGGMRSAFQPARAIGVDEVYRFELTGERGGTWTVMVRDGTIAISRGTVGTPTVRLELSDRRFVELAAGQAEAGDLIVRGEMKIEGDLQRAAMFTRFFTPPGA